MVVQGKPAAFGKPNTTEWCKLPKMTSYDWGVCSIGDVGVDPESLLP